MDIKRFYNAELNGHTNVMFNYLMLTKKGCETMIQVISEANFADYKNNLLESEMEQYFNRDGSVKEGKMHNVAIELFVEYICQQWCDLNAKEELFDDGDGAKEYKDACLKFLRSTEFFLEKDLDKYGRLLGRFMMGGQYTMRNCLLDILYQVK